MRIPEIFQQPEPERLDELNLKRAIAAAGLIGATSLAPGAVQAGQPAQHTAHTQTVKHHTPSKFRQFVNSIVDRYKVTPDFAAKVVKLAHKYQRPDFPTQKDILAIIGIESSFDPSSVSNLKKDPALGLMQVRPEMHGIDPNELSTDIESQIKHGTRLYHKFYKRLNGDKAATLLAYNNGLTNYFRGNYNNNYLNKYQDEISTYDQMEQSRERMAVANRPSPSLQLPDQGRQEGGSSLKLGTP